MEVSVTHNGTNITQHVIKYDREHKICTGIGMLEIEVSYEYSNSFNPWDVIVINENGRKSGQYYVSTTSEAQPSSSILVTAQDNSKKLSDYFISDSYNVDYPSYNRFWIEYFLDEVGINYTFLTPEAGALLSNYTALGLMTAYEQIMMLVQMSGWYFTFDYNGRMLIGKASSSFGSKKGTYTNRDIMDISTQKSDRMLRNRVVVWGKGDPESGRWVFADVIKRTKWDYDSKDKRTIVISNANIRRTADAFSLANKVLLEFSNITVEKHIQVTGAKNLVVGDIVGIRNLTFTGSGKVTTFGTSMSRNGLVTNIVLDERCPRLFGFFDIGGYVYVGTFGSGVWRKQILPQSWSGSGVLGIASGLYNASGWQNYSSGLLDLNITDLHVNAGLLTSVSSSGKAFYSLEDETPWNEIDFQGLTVSMSGVPIVTSGTSGQDLTTYSGIMARACIIDRDTNSVRLAVDTRSGINYGDFLMETDPLSPLLYNMYSLISPSGYEASGVFLASGVPTTYRSWVVDTNGYDGSINGAYPVGVSGNYNFIVFDIDNDGTSDYVSAMSIGSGAGLGEYNYFQGDGDSERNFYDSSYISLMPYSGIYTPDLQTPSVVEESFGSPFNIYDHTTRGISFVVGQNTKSATSSVKVFQTDIVDGQPLVKRVTSHTAISGQWQYIGGSQVSDNVFRCVMLNESTLATEFWDLTINLSGSISGTVTRTALSSGILTGIAGFGYKSMSHGDYFYATTYGNDSPNNGFKWYLTRVSLITGAVENKLVYSATGTGTGHGQFQYYSPQLTLCGNGLNDVAAYVSYLRRDFSASPTAYKCYGGRLIGFDNTAVVSMMFDWSAAGYGTSSFATALSTAKNFNNNDFFCYMRWRSSTEEAISICIDDTYTVYDDTGVVPDAFNTATHATQNLGPYPGGLVKTSSPTVFYDADIATGTVTPVVVPSNYTLITFAGTDTQTGERFYSASNTISGQVEIIAVNPSGAVSRRTYITSGGINRLIGNYVWAGNLVYMDRDFDIVYPTFYILQRDNYDFNVIKAGAYRERIEISNYAPIVTMDRRISSLQTYYISMNGGVTTSYNATISGYAMSGVQSSGSLFTLGVLGDDMRYAGFETTVESGYPQNLYVVFSGQIGSIDLSDLSTMSGIFTTQSGQVKRLEMSNYVFPDQYVFAALSGYMASGVAGSGWGFIQRNPDDSATWVDYSAGYPQSRTTIIRYDDTI